VVSARPILILGATSAIARSTAASFAAQGHALYLAARDADELRRIAADFGIRFRIPVKYGTFDATDIETHNQFLQHVVAEIGSISGVVVAIGYLGDQQVAQVDSVETQAIIARNFSGVASILMEAANYLEAQRSGFIIGITSVAGDRGRQSNYTYGASKGALGLYLQGLRNRLVKSCVRVITVKPGFVDTAMTYGKEGTAFVASPGPVGNRIAKAIHGRADVVYIPWFWRYIMFVIRNIPEPLFKRLKL
jgi:decaprenylphospho-beta-D-erythro-pentofuranosid-2-ulose 2-reductase